MRKLLTLPIFLTLFAIAVVGCGGSEVLYVYNPATTTPTTPDNGLSGQVGTINIQTQVATAQTLAQEVLVIRSAIIPANVTEIRFTGVDAGGTVIYGPVVRSTGTRITLSEVPIEVVGLRIELLVNGQIIGGLVTDVDVSNGTEYLILDPLYVFAGVAEETPDVVDPVVVYGSFLSQGTFGLGSQENPVSVVDFPVSQVTNGVEYLGPADPLSESNTGRGQYRVSQSGDYLLTYNFIKDGGFGQLASQQVEFIDGFQVFRNEVPVENAFTDDDQARLAVFQHIVHLEAGDYVSLRGTPFLRVRAIRAQTDQEAYPIEQGTFTIVLLGNDGTVHPAPVPVPR